MVIDGITLAALTDEIKKQITGLRISRIYQPEGDEIIFLLSNKNRLLISSSGERPRICLTTLKKNNPDKAPNFCMLLRKYILSGKILGIEQVGLERIVKLTIEARDELGNLSILSLICEFMGHQSNIILIDENENVIDSMRRVSPDISSIRQILPGIRYSFPPLGKRNILEYPAEQISSILKKDISDGTSFSKSLVNNFEGMFPALARNIVADSEDPDLIAVKALNTVKKAVYEPEPCIDYDENDCPKFFSSVPLEERLLSRREFFSSLSDMLDSYYSVLDIKRIVSKEASFLSSLIKKNISNVEKRLKSQYDILLSAKDAEKLRVSGELLTANLYQIKKGASSAEVYDYYTDSNIIIPLDPKFSPAVNAQRYYKKYGKLKTAENLAEKSSTKLKAELDYLEELLYNTTQINTMDDAEDIKSELIRQGYIKEARKEKVKMRDPLSSPMKFRSSDGFLILAGRNSRQNDALTMRAASDGDIWLHSKNLPGSHVIIFTEGKTVSAQAVFEAATIAACNSKGASSGKVDIDYTERRNVWKPNGAKPGMVLFENNKTVSVKPDTELINKLKAD